MASKPLSHPIDCAHDQGRVLAQVLLWLVERLPPEERGPFLAGA